MRRRSPRTTRPPMAIAKIRELLAAVEPPTEEHDAIVDRVAAMMALSTASFPVTELMWGARRLLELVSTPLPLLVVIDDIQSAEQTFLDFLDLVLASPDRAPILLLCTSRHELIERHPEWSLAHADETITLEPLTDAQTGTAPRPAARRSRAGGPRADRDQRGRQSAVRRADRVDAPGDRRDPQGGRSLGVGPRRDGPGDPADGRGPRRGPARRARARRAGRDRTGIGHRDVVCRRGASPSSSTTRSGHASRRISARSWRSSSFDSASSEEGFYRFGHIIIRDTTYGSLLKRFRATLHERFVVWAERVNRERGRETEFEEILGYHLERAFRYRTELGVIDDEARGVAARAAVKLGNAGRRALDRSDLSAATNLLSRAVDLIERPGPERVLLLTELSEAHLAGGALDEARVAARRAIDDATEIGDERLQMSARVADSVIDVFRGEERPAVTLDRSAEAIALFDRLGDGSHLARAWRLRSWQHNAMGRADEAAEDSLRAAEAGLQAGDLRIANRAAMGYGSNAVNGSATVADVTAQCRELLDRVQGDRKAESVILGALSQLLAMNGQFDEARAMAGRARQLLLDLGPSALAFATSTDTFRVEVLAGDLGAAEALLRRDDADLAGIGETYFRSTVVARLANVVALQGRRDEGLALAETAASLASDDDTEAQILWRIARAHATVGTADPEASVLLAEEAKELAAATGSPLYLAEAETTLGDALAAGGIEGSEAAYERALRLYADKGDRVSAQRLRAMTTGVTA